MITVTYWLDGKVLAHYAVGAGCPPTMGDVFVHREKNGVQRRLQVAEVESSNGTRDAVDLEIDVRLRPLQEPAWPTFPEGPMPRCAICGAVCPASGRCFSCDPTEGFQAPAQDPTDPADLARTAAHAARMVRRMHDDMTSTRAGWPEDKADRLNLLATGLENLATEWRAIHDENQKKTEEEAKEDPES